jgi:hypothetical protein
MTLPHVSETIESMLTDFRLLRDREIEGLAFVLPQYVADHNDKQAYRDIGRQVNQLARSLDRMIAALTQWQKKAKAIEQSCEKNFYGD